MYNLFQLLLATDNAVGHTTSRQPTTVVSAATGPADPVSARPVPVLTVARHCDSDCVISPSPYHPRTDTWGRIGGPAPMGGPSLSLFSCHLASAGTLYQRPTGGFPHQEIINHYLVLCLRFGMVFFMECLLLSGILLFVG